VLLQPALRLDGHPQVRRDRADGLADLDRRVADDDLRHVLAGAVAERRELAVVERAVDGLLRRLDALAVLLDRARERLAGGLHARRGVAAALGQRAGGLLDALLRGLSAGVLVLATEHRGETYPRRRWGVRGAPPSRWTDVVLARWRSRA